MILFLNINKQQNLSMILSIASMWGNEEFSTLKYKTSNTYGNNSLAFYLSIHFYDPRQF